ncbi:MAG: tetratricopeptide repeat protein [Algicola sp.]|nr:tetratricopeptide repeat protein [Algicola sp.]
MYQLQWYQFLLLYVLLFVQSCHDNKDIQVETNQPKIDSIQYWINASKDRSLTPEQKHVQIDKAYKALANTDDSLKHAFLSDIAYCYFKFKDTTKFKKVNQEALEIAQALKDTLSIADIHWSYADFYNKNEKYSNAFYHYNTAYNYFSKKGVDYETGRMLYAMSYIKGRFKDYSGSEVLNIKAIDKFKRIKNYKYLYISYNHLAVLQNDIDEYDRSLLYHEMAMEYLDKLDDKSSFISTSLNNIGSVYLQKKNYQKALVYFQQALKETQSLEDKARIIDNIAYVELLSEKDPDLTFVENQMLRALHIRDSLDNKSGVVVSQKHLGEYYLKTGDTAKAHVFIHNANKTAKSIKNSRDYLSTLQLLAKVDQRKSQLYLNEYIRYDDSLKKVEWQLQNKFTRIAYETDEYIEETKRLSQQRIWISVAALGSILILTLLFYIRVQKSKNERLIMEGEQQKANEQVYLLSLRQQSKLEEERIKERNRISEELHDGILGRLFGARMGLGFLELKGNDEALHRHETLMAELQDIEKEIREVSHRLHNNSKTSQINFESILNKLLQNKSKIGDFSFTLRIDDNFSWEHMSDFVKVNLYRIIQESLQNIIRHAKATHVNIQFWNENDQIKLIIEDDGIGFNNKKVKKGIGLKNIQSRVHKLHGQLHVKSIPDKGTKISIELPIKPI